MTPDSTPIRLAITGRMGSGKDTLADYVAAELLYSRSVVRAAFADALKDELAEMVRMCTMGQPPPHILRGEMRADKQTNGPGWQWWGEYRRKHFGEDYWIRHPVFQQKIKSAMRYDYHMIVTDMRHHNECEWLHKNGFYLVRVEGRQDTSNTRSLEHPSEIHVKELKVHRIYENTGSLSDMISWIVRVLLPSLKAHVEHDK